MIPTNPAQLEKLMKSLGMKATQLEAEEVVIRGKDWTIRVENPQVVKIEMKGNVSFQVSGEVKEELGFSEEDVKLVMEKAGVDEERAKKALKEAGGDIAEAIMLLRGE